MTIYLQLDESLKHHCYSWKYSNWAIKAEIRKEPLCLYTGVMRDTFHDDGISPDLHTRVNNIVNGRQSSLQQHLNIWGLTPYGPTALLTSSEPKIVQTLDNFTRHDPLYMTVEVADRRVGKISRQWQVDSASSLGVSTGISLGLQSYSGRFSICPVGCSQVWNNSRNCWVFCWCSNQGSWLLRFFYCTHNQTSNCLVELFLSAC